ncbi:MafI family immunity protein [Desulfococcaceae bacterium OttesenSCG-928-F15]|nr:MafI family immunity protein [Desulfococcaceae bacterium OttesenSCG-928-F15]
MIKEAHYEKLEILFAALHPHLAPILSGPEMAEVMEYLYHGEYGIALETLCFIIEDGKKPITQEIHELIDQLGTLMEMEKDLWKPLKALIRK